MAYPPQQGIDVLSTSTTRVDILSNRAVLNTDHNEPQKSPSDRRLRRSKSFSCLPLSPSSSVTSMDDCESIYNAELIQPFEDLVPLESAVSHLVITNYSRPRLTTQTAPINAHRRRPLTKLDPIIERRSSRSLRSTGSVVLLRPSLERQSMVVRPQVSIHSVHAREAAITLDYTEPATQHTKFFSLNDLDCFPRSDTDEAIRLHYRWPGSSSTEVEQSIHCRPAVPLQPAYSPRNKPLTPTELPSFGHKDTQQFRLVPISVCSLAMKSLRQWFQKEGKNKTDSTSVDGVGEVATSGELIKDKDQNQPADMLRCVLGATRKVRVSRPRPNSKAKLPVGVKLAPPADDPTESQDGALVGDRWFYRSTADGVGNGDLGHQSFAIPTVSNTLASTVVNKMNACVDADQLKICEAAGSSQDADWIEQTSSAGKMAVTDDHQQATFDGEGGLSNIACLSQKLSRSKQDSLSTAAAHDVDLSVLPAGSPQQEEFIRQIQNVPSGRNDGNSHAAEQAKSRGGLSYRSCWNRWKTVCHIAFLQQSA